jgi:hypothetical protein
MNWRRGLFRLWIVGSALFVLAVAFVSYSDIKEEFEAVARKPYASSTLAPNLNTKIVEFEGRLHEFPADATDEEIATALNSEKPGMFDDLIPAPKPWKSVGMWAAIALSVPLVVLVLGSSLVWAFSGFAATRK